MPLRNQQPKAIKLANAKIRDFSELAMAHDTFTHILLTDELYEQLGEAERRALVISTDVLCWVLHHDHNTQFVENYQHVREWLKSQGYESVRVQ